MAKETKDKKLPPAFAAGMRGNEEAPEGEEPVAAAPDGDGKKKEEKPAGRKRAGSGKDRGIFGSGMRGAEKQQAAE